jgi:hypothetical protein
MPSRRRRRSIERGGKAYEFDCIGKPRFCRPLAIFWGLPYNQGIERCVRAIIVVAVSTECRTDQTKADDGMSEYHKPAKHEVSLPYNTDRTGQGRTGQHRTRSIPRKEQQGGITRKFTQQLTRRDVSTRARRSTGSTSGHMLKCTSTCTRVKTMHQKHRAVSYQPVGQASAHKVLNWTKGTGEI